MADVLMIGSIPCAIGQREADVIMIGSIPCAIGQREKFVEEVRLVSRKRMVEKVIEREEQFMECVQVKRGCTERCAGLAAYTKSSLSRAIKEGDLTRSARCPTCGILALVGPGREFLTNMEFPNVRIVREVVMVEEEYFEEEKVTRKVVEPLGCTFLPNQRVHPTVAAKVVAAPPYIHPGARKEEQDDEDGEEEKSDAYKLFELYFNKPEMRETMNRKKFGKIVKTARGLFVKNATKEEVQVKLEEERAMNEFEKHFHKGDLEEFSQPGAVKIYDLTVRGERVSFASPFYTRTIKANQKRGEVQKKRQKKITLPVSHTNQLIESVCRIMRKRTGGVEFIKGKDVMRVMYKTIASSKLAIVQLPHMKGIKKDRELHPRKFTSEIRSLLKASKVSRKLRQEHITFGFSGAILPQSVTTQLAGNFEEFVVRGRHEGKLIDARMKVGMHMKHKMHHYSSAEKEFWNGWKRVFDQTAPLLDHECVADIGNTQCGEIVASIFQSIHPCKRVSCKECRQTLVDMSKEEYFESLTCNATQRESSFRAIRERYASVETVLRNIQRTSVLNQNLADISEVTRLTQGSRATQMQQIAAINETLLKGSTVTIEELGKATKHLLELTRWFKNHLTQMDHGAVEVFRNKASSKASINFSLLCDNQLDKNGNFVWGERGYHSRRFFSNFFEEVVPGDGYTRYINRKNPNGTRKLAIGHLVVPLNLDRARRALEGEAIQLQPTSEACISRNVSFEYTCCCVTSDTGKPFYSTLKSPTKRHLVIGNTGDAKYVDLPTTEDEKMYIAKDGYCYLNIFLAMLINVNESSAKDFTKTVRDVIVPMLGTWPTMYDLATACYILTVLHPETRNAELPRILIDHENQIMHVIDSFGSLNVGYHVLKAGTIQQLLPFASEALQGEMKFYKVGGSSDSYRRQKLESILIKSVYRPRLLQQVIEDDPYILFLSIVTPKLIIALYNSGGIDAAMQYWIDKDTNLSTAITALALLAERVSRGQIISEQVGIIHTVAVKLVELLDADCIRSMSKKEVLMFVEGITKTVVMNEQLTRNGFNNFDVKLYDVREKTYADKLQCSWSELSWLEKFTAIRQSRRARKCIIKQSTDEDLCRVETKYALSCSWLPTQIKALRDGTRDFISVKKRQLSNRVHKMVIRRVSSVLNGCLLDVFQMVNLLVVISLFIQVVGHLKSYIIKQRKAKHAQTLDEYSYKMAEVEIMYSFYSKVHGKPTEGEFVDYVRKTNPNLVEFVIRNVFCKVEMQGKTYLEANFEKIIAFMALITMIFDERKSDVVFKGLNKIRAAFNTINEVVKFQGVDEIDSIEDEKKETIDFVLGTDMLTSSVVVGSRFEDWWRNQIEQNRVIPHYRNNGTFLEFTRNTLIATCNNIQTSQDSEFLIRGAVGSGKSTGLPHQLGKKGKVLIIEPTRPLAENVCKQLRKEPFYNNATLRMRGLSTFGSSNVTVMTSGFALHYFANNQGKIEDFSFVIIDECHVIDASAMAFYCLLKEYSYQGKILKVSATPPGRECEFTTQFPVKLKVEECASFDDFVAAQGTGSNMDVVQDGDNILIYVASYNDVDQLSKKLIGKGHLVTKVDGRTMKLGSVEILTKGSSSLKHFVVATNIIENGVTLDIDVVVDFGMKVQAELDTDTRSMQYTRTPVSYGERIQRLGRVGRVRAGTGLRIGHTEKGVNEIPTSIATEAAFLCFAYGLPVMTHNVTTSMLAKCTIPQARAMLHFELPCFLMVDLVSSNGSMHPVVHEEVKKFKLRDSEITLSKLAIPSVCVNKWMSVREYGRCGVRIQLDDNTKIPFYSNNIPDSLYTKIWAAVNENKHDAGFGRLRLSNACKIAYTLSIDPIAMPRTLGILEQIIQQEMEKKAHFENMTSSLTSQSFSLQGIADRVKKRYLQDHTSSNIQVLNTVKAQIMEFDAATHDLTKPQTLLPYGFLDIVQMEGVDAVSKRLELKGRWNHGLMARDVVASLMIAIGGAWMAWDYFKFQTQDVVVHQGKRKIQKLKFRDAHDKKLGREVFGDDGIIEHTFGEAYTKRGKVKGNNKVKGMGAKTRNFVHLYGFDPTEYSFVRFLDPLTGATIDESPQVDMGLVQETFSESRKQAVLDDELTHEMIAHKPEIKAYFVNSKTHKAIKVDLHPHNPLLVCRTAASISGFPEREYDLRQTGPAAPVAMSEVPQQKEMVQLEGKSILRGPRDYNPTARSVCQIINRSDGHTLSMHAIGFGSILIAPGHFFQRNNGEFEVQSHMGTFKVHNTTQLKVHHCKGRDLILIRMPKDFPPFPQRLRFRQPQEGEKCCMVSSIYQQRSMSSCVSETTTVMPTDGCFYWKHWISSSDGTCGLPLVSTKDGFIVGIHGLGGMITDKNYFVAFPENFEKDILSKLDEIEWKIHWKFNTDKVLWGRLCYAKDEEDAAFKVSKYINDLSLIEDDVVAVQGCSKWVFDNLSDNLKAIGETESHLVTKHVIKGRCEFFHRYLSEQRDAANFFKPLMSHYGPSKLNKEAFKKDFFKYKTIINVGKVDATMFEKSVDDVIHLLDSLNFGVCNFVTDPDEILSSLNMKASVGALFKGKKAEYFGEMTRKEQEYLIELSCKRLFEGKMGVWNGSLKAELRSVEKLEANKTRTFTAAPIDTLLGGKVCVDDFNNRFYSLNLTGPWTVGMTKFYGGWDGFLRSLPENWVYCHADGSRFDSSLTPYLINSIITIRTHFMEDWWVGRRMLNSLYTEVVYTPILTPDGTVVKKFKGNNSGQPSTVVDNTLMVVVTMYYALNKQKVDVEKLDSVIKFFANGDDLVIAIEPSHTALLDTLQESFAELGLDYDFSERSRDKSNIEFMSHRGFLVDNMFIPKLDQERIVSILEWDRSKEISHRAEAICAAMIEAWGYSELLTEIRRFYDWLMDLPEFRDLANCGVFPYISETALRKLYTNKDAHMDELEAYYKAMNVEDEGEFDIVTLQGDKSELDAGLSAEKKKNTSDLTKALSSDASGSKEKDVDTGSRGNPVPRLKSMGRKMKLPKIGKEVTLNLEHLLEYKPEQEDLSNARATHKQFGIWHRTIMEELDITEEQMKVVMNGFMVWCIENGTSPNINGVWTMMDGEEQVEFPIKPFVENAKPTLRQIMHHFSDAAEAYIEFRNAERSYIPRYALIRNLRDSSLARFAFDFYEMNSKTPTRAREAHLQMKAAALANVSTRMFGLDGNIATQEENTERHIATDVNTNMHTLNGARYM